MNHRERRELLAGINELARDDQELRAVVGRTAGVSHDPDKLLASRSRHAAMRTWLREVKSLQQQYLAEVADKVAAALASAPEDMVFGRPKVNNNTVSVDAVDGKLVIFPTWQGLDKMRVDVSYGRDTNRVGPFDVAGLDPKRVVDEIFWGKYPLGDLLGV